MFLYAFFLVAGSEPMAVLKPISLSEPLNATRCDRNSQNKKNYLANNFYH